MGVINILRTLVESADSTGYVKIGEGLFIWAKYILIISTGENGASCPATTYAISFDQKTESVTGKRRNRLAALKTLKACRTETNLL